MAATIKKYRNEIWKNLKGHISQRPGYKYAISDYGRIVRYNTKMEEGNLLRFSRQGGYPIWRKKMNGTHFAALVHRLVAANFLPKPTADKRFIIHLDHNKENNKASNLRWATQQEVTKHNARNPLVIASMKERKLNHFIVWSKLTEAKVVVIKKMLAKGKTLREIASKYNVSDMQIHRIKTGENWAHIGK